MSTNRKLFRRRSAQLPATPAAPTADLNVRLTALAEAAELGRPYLPEDEISRVVEVATKGIDRIRHGTNHTVVAIAGATGSGKSSIVNRLAGAELSTSSVRRPTTSVTHAAVWGQDDAGSLLDWLEIQRRHTVENPDPALDGLVLLDLPDHDSTAVEHRLEVDRLVKLVDVLIWVTDPQKYADEALHHGYIQPLASHAEVLRFLLNQADLIPDQVDNVTADLGRLLRQDGVADPTILPISARTGHGFEPFETLLAESVQARKSVVDRLNADIDGAVELLQRSTGSVDTKGKNRSFLISGLGQAAGAKEVAAVAAAHHRRQGILKMGWPLTRFVRRLGKRPLADLPGPGRAPASKALTDTTLRDYAEKVSTPLSKPWPSAVRKAASSRRDQLIDELRSSIGTAAVGAGRKPKWWTFVAWLQRGLAGVALAGLAWLLIVAVLGGFFQFDTEPLLPPTPEYEWMPLPSALLLGGAVSGLLLGFIVRLPLGLAMNRRARRARKEVEASVENIADTLVIAPVDQLIGTQQNLEELLQKAARR